MDIQKRQRPTGALVIGILYIIFGSLGLLGACCGGGSIGLLSMLGRNNPALQNNPSILQHQFMVEHYPLYLPGMITTLTLGLIISIGELIAGIGLLKMSSWARRLGIAIAVLILCQCLISAAYQLLVSIPGADRFWSNPPPQMQNLPPEIRDFNRMISMAGLLGLLPSLIYGGAALIVLLRPSMRDAFAGVPVQLPDEAEDDDPRWTGSQRSREGSYGDEDDPSTGITEKRPD